MNAAPQRPREVELRAFPVPAALVGLAALLPLSLEFKRVLVEGG